MSGWNTIESDAGVFTYLIENLGVKNVQFEEIIDLSPEYLKAVAPVYGVIFLFKYISSKPDDEVDGSYDFEASENLFFAKQTIQNACATQAILSVLLNKGEQTGGIIDIGTSLEEFREFTQAFPSDLRGEALSNSQLIRDVHNSFARSNPFIDENTRAATEDDDVYHFIAYTPINGVLYELDGLQAAPLSHGPCTDDEFSDKVIPVLQRRIARYPITEIRFNLMAVIKDQRLRAMEIGDLESIKREQDKREAWQWENALRKHNFVGFAHEVLKGIVRMKTSEGSYQEWLDSARKEMAKRVAEKKAKGHDELDD